MCCARERMIELACPESCPYLAEARATASARETALRVKETSAVDPRRLLLDNRAMIALDRIEHAIVNAQRGVEGAGFRDLTDVEILDAVENTIKNLETEESGLIYEHHSASPRITEISRRIREALDQIDRAGEEIPAEFRPRRSDVARALGFSREAVSAHLNRAESARESSRSYIRYISLFYPWPEEATGPQIVLS